MKLFLDTSNKKLIMAIINDEDQIVSFSMKDSNNDMVKNTLPKLETFLKRNEISFENIEEYMVTTGPGSFTGVKVAINIIRTINLVHKVKKISTISTFDLVTIKGTKFTALKTGKTKFYLRNNRFKNIKKVDELTEKIKESLTMDYKKFNEKHLQEKINGNSFKVLDNIDKVKINYLNKF